MAISKTQPLDERIKTIRDEIDAFIDERAAEIKKTADSDDLARVFRFDLAQDSEMISPTIPI